MHQSIHRSHDPTNSALCSALVRTEISEGTRIPIHLDQGNGKCQSDRYQVMGGGGADRAVGSLGHRGYLISALVTATRSSNGRSNFGPLELPPGFRLIGFYLLKGIQNQQGTTNGGCRQNRHGGFQFQPMQLPQRPVTGLFAGRRTLLVGSPNRGASTLDH